MPLVDGQSLDGFLGPEGGDIVVDARDRVPFLDAIKAARQFAEGRGDAPPEFIAWARR